MKCMQLKFKNTNRLKHVLRFYLLYNMNNGITAFENEKNSQFQSNAIQTFLTLLVFIIEYGLVRRFESHE